MSARHELVLAVGSLVAIAFSLGMWWLSGAEAAARFGIFYLLGQGLAHFAAAWAIRKLEKKAGR